MAGDDVIDYVQQNYHFRGFLDLDIEFRCTSSLQTIEKRLGYIIQCHDIIINTTYHSDEIQTETLSTSSRLGT